MTTIQTELTEMKDTKVQFISFVKRAASGIPLRIIKRDPQENSMIDMQKLFAKKTEVAPPAKPVAKPLEVVGVAVKGLSDEAAVAAVSKSLTEGTGLAIAEVATEGDVTTFIIEKAENVMTLQVNDHLTLVVKALPEVAVKAEAAVAPVLADLAKKAEEAVAAKKAEDEAAAAEAAKKSGPACPEGIKHEDWDKMSDEEKAKHAKKSDTAVADPVKSADELAAEQAAVQKAEADARAAELAAAVATALAPVTAAVADLTKKMDEMKNSTETRIDELARKAETAANAVKNTVVTTAKADTAAAATEQTKKDDLFSGCFDTGLIGRGKK